MVLKDRDELCTRKGCQIGDARSLEGLVIGSEKGEALSHGGLEDLEDTRGGKKGGEGLAPGLLEKPGEVGTGGGGGVKKAWESDRRGDLDDGEVVRFLFDGFGVSSIRFGAGSGGGEGDLATALIGDVHKP